ncbi:hypothetical protein [Sutcliffiella halmapala]|uniref:hypothetical protein n=1 Tax=Sutcliffiella halmapala TaxID=79882 RepID=UPI0009952CE8|nr:hypothetical protein [Sutcliffiella halmapala]
MTYRPTVRYHRHFKDYVEDVFDVSALDRGQIIRAALYSAAFTSEFRELISPHLKQGKELPSPNWEWKEEDHRYWLDTNAKYGEVDVTENMNRSRKESSLHDADLFLEIPLPDLYKPLKEEESTEMKFEGQKMPVIEIDVPPSTLEYQGIKSNFKIKNEGGIKVSFPNF